MENEIAAQPSRSNVTRRGAVIVAMGAVVLAACSTSTVSTTSPAPAVASVSLDAATPAASAASAASASPTSSAAPTDPAAPTPTASEDPLLARAEAEIAVPGGPDLPIEAFGSLWLLTPDSDEPAITRLDPTTNQIVATIPVGSRLCQGLGASDDAIWACGEDGVLRVDPETDEVVTTVELPTAQIFGYLPFGGGALWALGGEVSLTDQLVRIDPETDRVTDQYELGFDASWITYGEDALWITDTAAGTLWKFDPTTMRLTEHASGLEQPGPSAVGAGSVWLAVNAGEESRPSATDVTLVRIDPASGAIHAEIPTGGSIHTGLIHASQEAIWVRAPEPFLTRVDPATNEIVEAIHANYAGGSVTVAYGSLWATSYDFHRVWRLRP